MAQSITGSMPQLMDLPDGYVVQWAAIDDATGADVAGVVVKNVSLYGQLLVDSAASGNTVVGPYMLVPGPGA